MSQSIKCSHRTKWEASCLRTVREGKDMNRHPMEGGPIDATYKTTLAQRDKVTWETTCVKWLDHTAWPSLTRKRRVLGNELLVYLSEKHFGDVFIHSFGRVGTLSRERTTSDPVLSSGTSTGLTKSSAAPFARIPSVLSTAGLLSQGALRLPCTTAYFTRNAPVTEATLRHEQPVWSRSFTPDCNWLRKNLPFPTN